MKAGGNKAAKAYFEKNDLIQSGQHNYASPLAAKYRTSIAKKAESKKKEAEEHEVIEKEEEEEIEKAVVVKAKAIEKKSIIVEKKTVEQPIPAK